VTGRGSEHIEVAIVGAGPAGIGVAVGLARHNVSPVALIDRGARLGGIPAKYEPTKGGVPTFVVWTHGRVVFGRHFIQPLIRKLDKTQAHQYLETEVLGVNPERRELTILSARLGKQALTANAVVLACGSREKSLAERGWIAGARPARIYSTMHLLDLLDANDCLPMRRPAIIGSDLIAFSAAAKLRAAGADESIMIDRHSRPRSNTAGRLYFRRWCTPAWRPAEGVVSIENTMTAKGLRFRDSLLAACDGAVVSGDLIPNSELALEAGLEVRMPERVPVAWPGYQLSEHGWFAAGNLLGQPHGAQWCYFNGLRVAKSVARYLKARR
jgi:NADPH-dependent 2,4-dienoyl-CoA reductase/sulfur reductase-like enzyme